MPRSRCGRWFLNGRMRFYSGSKGCAERAPFDFRSHRTSARRNGRIQRDGGRSFMQTAFSHASEYGQIKKVHGPKHEENEPDFGAQGFHCFLRIRRRGAVFQGESDVTDIDKIKSNHQQMIDRVRQRFVAEETIHEKNPSVFVESPRHPDGEANTDEEIRGVSSNEPVHNRSFLLFCCFCHYRITITHPAAGASKSLLLRENSFAYSLDSL